MQNDLPNNDIWVTFLTVVLNDNVTTCFEFGQAFAGNFVMHLNEQSIDKHAQDGTDVWAQNWYPPPNNAIYSGSSENRRVN